MVKNPLISFIKKNRYFLYFCSMSTTRLVRLVCGKKGFSVRFFPAIGIYVFSQLFVFGGGANAQVVLQDLTALGATSDPLSDGFQSDTDRRYAPQGLLFGPLAITGSADEAMGYTNNADKMAGGSGSSAFQTNANLDARLVGSSSAIRMGGEVSSIYYPSVKRQNQTTWTTQLQGYKDLGSNYIKYRYEHQRQNQMPTDLGALALSRPIPYNDDSLDLSDSLRLHGRLTVTGGVHGERFVFSEVPGVGAYFQQSYRNRFLINENIGLRYSLADSSSLLAVFQGAQIRYTADPYNLPKRDSDGFMALVGYDYAFPGPFQLRVLGGYQRRNYASQLYRPFETFYSELRGVWSPTHMTKVSVEVSRGIADSAFENIIGFVYTTASVHVKHIYSRNLILQAEASIQLGGAGRTPSFFQNTPLYQENQFQKNYVFKVSAERRISRHFSLSLINSFMNANAAGTNRYSIDCINFDLKYSL